MDIDIKSLTKPFRKLLRNKFPDIRYWIHQDGWRLSDDWIKKIINIDQIPVGNDVNYFSIDVDKNNGPFRRKASDTKKYRTLESVLCFMIYSIIDHELLENPIVMLNTGLNPKKFLSYILDYHMPLEIHKKMEKLYPYTVQKIIKITKFIDNKYNGKI